MFKRQDKVRMANSVDADQTALGLHCLPRPSVSILRIITPYLGVSK